MQGGISLRGPLIPPTNSANFTKTFECHPNAHNHGTLMLSLASVGVAANGFLAALIIARRSLRRWSSGLLLHGTFVDGARAALLIPLALSVLRCHPVPRCSLVDTAFLLLATVTSLNLLTASLSDAPLLPPPVLVPSLLQSAGYIRSQSSNHYASPLYPKGNEYASYYSDYYEEDANLLAETTAMPDSPQCVLFGTFMVWFAALTINLGPTFLSGALAAQAESMPRRKFFIRTTSCPLVRGPARHVVLNTLWATVNLLSVGLAAAHLRKLKKDLARARLGLLAAAGAGLAGMAGIQTPGYTHTSAVSASCNNPGVSSTASIIGGGGGHGSHHGSHHGSSHGLNSSASNLNQSHHRQASQSPAEVDSFLRQAQRNGRCHIRTLGTLAVANLLCWVPLYLCAIVAPVGTGTWEDPAPYAYEITLMAAFAHSGLHPVLLLFLHQPLRHGLKHCVWEWCCFVCNFCGMEFEFPNSNENSPQHSRLNEMRVGQVDPGIRSSSRTSHHSSHHGSHPRLHTSESLVSLKRSASLKSTRDADISPPLPHDDLMSLPPPPPPSSSSVFRKQVSMEEQSVDNRW